jgi:hypothetical protein
MCVGFGEILRGKHIRCGKAALAARFHEGLGGEAIIGIVRLKHELAHREPIECSSGGSKSLGFGDEAGFDCGHEKPFRCKKCLAELLVKISVD